MVLAACGDDAETNNGTVGNNGGVTDTGQADTGHDAGDDVGHDVGGDTADIGSDVADAGSDADANPNDGGQDTGVDAVDEDASVEALEINGVYDSNFNTVETITNESWEVVASWGTTDSPIIRYDNADNWTVTQNAADADFDPGKFNKIVWTEPGTDGVFYYCSVTFGEETADDAENTSHTADDTDPANSGCGGSSWTELTPQ
jgi:hypothetical protein